MKTLAPALALVIAACGSSPPPKKPCDAGLCGGVCCGPGTECLANQAGDQVCATLCALPTDCTDATEPCCMPVLVGGNYGGKAVCSAAPMPATAYTCTCGPNSGCGSLSMECAPLIGDTSGFISGPYVCLPNDGQNHHGCGMPPYCAAVGQYCATDLTGDQFCSTGCTSDGDCKNPGVACCNAMCHDNELCCGLCGH